MDDDVRVSEPRFCRRCGGRQPIQGHSLEDCIERLYKESQAVDQQRAWQWRRITLLTERVATLETLARDEQQPERPWEPKELQATYLHPVPRWIEDETKKCPETKLGKALDLLWEAEFSGPEGHCPLCFAPPAHHLAGCKLAGFLREPS